MVWKIAFIFNKQNDLKSESYLKQIRYVVWKMSFILINLTT